MGTYVVTGSASGIGAATAALLSSQGHRVVGVDRRDADVVADLGTPAGRQHAVEEVLRRADGRVNGVVPCAGLAGISGVDSRLLVSVNYFGAIAVVEGLRAALVSAASAGEPAAVVVISSNSTSCQPGWPTSLARSCLDGDEERTREVAGKLESVVVYPATKAALAWWARSVGTGREWAGSGVRVNAVAPGLVATAMTDEVRADPVFGSFADTYPTALDRPGRPEEVAALIGFLLSEQASLMVGSVVFADGGTDALRHPRRPTTRYVPQPVMALALTALRRRAGRRS